MRLDCNKHARGITGQELLLWLAGLPPELRALPLTYDNGFYARVAVVDRDSGEGASIDLRREAREPRDDAPEGR